MNWKNRYDDPSVGKKYKLRRDSDKSSWSAGIETESCYSRIYTIKNIGSALPDIELTGQPGNDDWNISHNFLKEHFKPV